MAPMLSDELDHPTRAVDVEDAGAKGAGRVVWAQRDHAAGVAKSHDGRGGRAAGRALSATTRGGRARATGLAMADAATCR